MVKCDHTSYPLCQLGPFKTEVGGIKREPGMSASATMNLKQGEVGLGGSMPVPMEVGGPTQPMQMDLKALLESHVLEHPLETAFHG